MILSQPCSGGQIRVDRLGTYTVGLGAQLRVRLSMSDVEGRLKIQPCFRGRNPRDAGILFLARGLRLINPTDTRRNS